MKLKIIIGIILFSSISFSQLNNNLNNFYMLGQNYVQAGELEKAKSIYEDLYKKNPNNYQIFDALNKVYIQLKEYNSSVQIINDFISFSPNNINLYGMLGTTYYLIGNENKAYETWDNALNNLPQADNNYRTIANYAIQLRTFQKAIEYLNKGKEISNDPKYFSFDLSNLYALTMQFKNAAKEYCSILSNDPQQLNVVQSRIFSYINKPKALDATIDVFKDYSGNKDNTSFDYILGRLYIENKSYREAYEIYKDIDEQSNNHGLELYNFAQIVFNEGQYSLSAEVYNDIIKKYPESPFASQSKLGYAKTLEANLDVKDSAEDWKQFHLINSDKSSDEEKVISAYLELPNIYPNSDVAYESYLHAGRIKLYHQNDLKGAEVYFNKIIDENPQSIYGAAAYAELGKISLLNGNLDSAAEDYFKNY